MRSTETRSCALSMRKGQPLKYKGMDIPVHLIGTFPKARGCQGRESRVAQHFLPTLRCLRELRAFLQVGKLQPPSAGQCQLRKSVFVKNLIGAHNMTDSLGGMADAGSPSSSWCHPSVTCKPEQPGGGGPTNSLTHPYRLVHLGFNPVPTVYSSVFSLTAYHRDKPQIDAVPSSFITCMFSTLAMCQTLLEHTVCLVLIPPTTKLGGNCEARFQWGKLKLGETRVKKKKISKR